MFFLTFHPTTSKQSNDFFLYDSPFSWGNKICYQDLTLKQIKNTSEEEIFEFILTFKYDSNPFVIMTGVILGIHKNFKLQFVVKF